MKKILLFTSSYDETVDYIVNKYSSDKLKFFRVNVDNMEEYMFSVRNNNWEIVSNKDIIINKNIDAIYYRKPEFPDIQMYELKYQNLIKKDIYALVTGLVDSFSGKVLTYPHLLRFAENKILQMRYAVELGMHMPKSLITNSTNESNDFIFGDTIIKPISTGKVDGELYFTNMIDSIKCNIEKTPIYLQQYIYKDYEVRITIIGEKIYAVKIECEDKIDWRKSYHTHQYSIIECPYSIKEKCKSLMLKLGIQFATIDYIVDKKGEWTFLEINPNGQWLWLEKSLNLEISYSIIQHLTME